MKSVFLLFDSLNRQAMSCYNQNARPTPSFDRLAKRGILFGNHYVSSLPCMPARRDILTGKLSFLHRSWGPVEPFDTCFPALLNENGIYSHLISDHYHYWEEGGCGYHNQYSSAEFVRGQERDLWKAMVSPPLERFKDQYHPMLSDVDRRRPNLVNREFIRQESDFPITKCVDLATEFLQHNHAENNWFLQVELFDPHEPFTAPDRFRDDQDSNYNGPVLDWPLYDQLELQEHEKSALRSNYQAIVAMCDYQLGRILDAFDQHDLWKDTAIILTSDHGFMLGEQQWWGKNVMPVFDPIAHIPLIMYHPENQANAGQRRNSLTQCLDLAPTILNIHSVKQSKTTSQSRSEFSGNSLLSLMNTDQSIRSHALYGLFGGAINVTDGRYTYFRNPLDPDSDLFEYTLMPTHPASYFGRREFEHAELIRGLEFAAGYPVIKIKALNDAKRPPMQGSALGATGHFLFDLDNDPGQLRPIDDPETEQRMAMAMTSEMKKYRAPSELYTRFGF